MYLNVCLFQNKSTGDRVGGLLPKNDFQTGPGLVGGKGGLLQERWSLILRDVTLKQWSD